MPNTVATACVLSTVMLGTEGGLRKPGGRREIGEALGLIQALLPTAQRTGSSRRKMCFTYPLPNEALLPRGSQRSKVTLEEAKHNPCGCV